MVSRRRLARRIAAGPAAQAGFAPNISRTDSFEHPVFGRVWVSITRNTVTRVRWSSAAFGLNGACRVSDPEGFPGLLLRLGINEQDLANGRQSHVR